MSAQEARQNLEWVAGEVFKPAACLTVPRVARCVFDMSGHDEFLVSHTFVQVGTSEHHFGVLIVFR